MIHDSLPAPSERTSPGQPERIDRVADIDSWGSRARRAVSWGGPQLPIACLLLVGLTCSTRLFAAPGLLAINEVHFAPDSAATNELLRFEYVELYNRGLEPIQVGGWELHDSTGLLFSFPALAIPPGAFLVVYSSAATGTLSEDVDLTDFSGRLIAGPSWSTSDLVNTGDAVQLFDGPSGSIRDYIYYDEANAGDPLIDDAAVAAGIWKDGAAIDTLSASSSRGRAIALRINGATPSEADAATDAEDNDWFQYTPSVGSTPGQPNVTTTFDSWRAQHFTGTELIDPAISGESADPDLDGIVNLLEYAFNLHPRQVSTDQKPKASLGADDFAVVYPKAMAATDVACTVERSTNLVNWTAIQPVNTLLAQDGVKQTIRAGVPIASQPVQYLRLVVKRLAK